MNRRADPNDLAPFGQDSDPLLTGVYAPQHLEATLTELPLLKGEIPRDLNGVYLRAGPNPRYAPIGRYHPFDGDGMVHGAHFDRGRVTYRNRWVRTDAWNEEAAAGKSTFHGIRETLKGRPDKRLKDSANTDLVAHAGRAVALWYMSGDAYEIDPVTLETIGKAPGVLRSGGGISAHAKVDEITDELLFFDYGTEAPYMHYGVIGPDRQLRHYVPVTLPGPRLPHDMAVTEHYSVLHDLPVFHDHDAFALGRHKIVFDPAMKTRFGVIPRYGAADSIRWFEFSPCFVYHVVNAWEEGDWLVQVGCRYMPALDRTGNVDANRTARDIAELVMHARLWVWRMNLKTGATEERMLDPDRNVEFPTYNSRLTGRRTRYGYLADQSDTRILQWHGIRKYDLDSGACLGYWSDSPEHCFYSEPWFAAADNPRSEDHGYVVTFQWHDELKRTTLDVFDALDLSAGPVAQLLVPNRIPLGFHACWMAADRMQARSAG